MVLPSVILESSKLRLCQGFIGAYVDELALLQLLLEKEQIDQETYDASSLAIDHDLQYLLSQTRSLREVKPGPPIIPDP